MSEPGRKKKPEELLREAVNLKGVQIVQEGFDAIDEFAEIAKAKIKRAILQALTGKKPRR